MQRHRATVYYPKLSQHNLIESLTSTNLKLQAPPNERFAIENRYMLPIATKPLVHIHQLRIQSKPPPPDTATATSSESEIFPFEFTPGLNIHVIPKNTIDDSDNDEFYAELKSVLLDLVEIEIGDREWTLSNGALFHFSTRASPLHANSTLLNVPNLPSLPIYDLIYNDGSFVVRNLDLDVDGVEYEMELGTYKEIGLFAKDTKVSISKDDVVLSGMRVVLDGVTEQQQQQQQQAQEGENRHKTLFHLKPRHRYLTNKVESRVLSAGLHPVLSTSFERDAPLLGGGGGDDDVEQCQLFYYLNLNRSLIFDEYQDVPADATLLVNEGIHNLESPEYKIEQWGNELMFELGEGSDNAGAPPQGVNLTLHSRYQLPRNNESLVYTEIYNAHPQLFYACQVKEGHLLAKQPFDTKKFSRLGGNYEGYFNNDTVFYHFEQVNPSPLLSFNIPHGTTTFDRINSSTFITLLIGILIILAGVWKKLAKSSTPVSQSKKTE
ncbi:uncharacterized protein LODBEIA_P42640 [Lodderomyces beijingensis]|uniref:Protein PBN1 n=1 Tax=Lodderomyces beijingensis TaxID=1775926 RepID=A0ABP0ZS57_9ASCO